MATIYEQMAASVLWFAVSYPIMRTPPFMEQVNNWVLTSLGHNAAGADNTGKYVTCFEPYTPTPGVPFVPTFGAAFVAAGITDPVGLEKVSQIVLTYTPPS